MPINAHAEFFEAEKKYHLAKTTLEKIKALEGMLREAPSHKGAESLRSEFKQRLAKLRLLQEKQSAKKGGGSALTIKKEGAAQVALISVQGAGKSLLLSKLTNAKPTISQMQHGFSANRIELGILDYKGVRIQMIELPAIYDKFAYSNPGPMYFSIIRNVDMILLILDLTKDIKQQMRTIDTEFEKAQIKLNRQRPPIIAKRMAGGGINFLGKEKLKANMEEVMILLREKGVRNTEIEFQEDTTIEDLEEALNESIAYKKALIIFNKSDIVNNKNGISALTGEGVGHLRDKLWDNLGLIKVFTKTPGKDKDWPPVALKRGDTIRSMAEVIHKDFYRRFRFARVWGKGAKFDGQTVGLDHKLADEDIVEFHLK